MPAVNDITGDSLRTKAASETYRNNYDMIFGKKKEEKVAEQPKVEKPDTETK